MRLNCSDDPVAVCDKVIDNSAPLTSCEHRSCESLTGIDEKVKATGRPDQAAVSGESGPKSALEASPSPDAARGV